ncbi:MAG: hypothetical protein J0M08_05120 [Bacteroidetes bacterium]|nr:hypothetical protein [Bacteroidota bacterium]
MEKEVTTQKRTKRPLLVSGLVSVFSGSFLTKENTLKQLPYVLFIALIALGYITNGYYTEQKIRDLNKVANEIKELKSEYITTKSEVVSISNQSEIAKAVEGMGLKESVVPPKKITIKDKTINTIN